MLKRQRKDRQDNITRLRFGREKQRRSIVSLDGHSFAYPIHPDI